MKLTKLQRHTAYILMLVDFEEKRTSTMNLCTVWYRWSNCDMSWKQMRYFLPELFKKGIKKNPDTMETWFKNDDHRIKALKQCIKETA